VILYELGYDTTEMEKLIENNITVFTRSNSRLQTFEKKQLKINMYGAEIVAVNSSVNNLCGSSFIIEKTKQKIIFYTRNNITIQDYCNSYPVILGINGFQIIEKDNTLHITKPNKAINSDRKKRVALS